MTKAYLFTNRNVLVFKDDILAPEIHEDLGWHSGDCRANERDAIKKILRENPAIYLAEWNTDTEPIHILRRLTPFEFCSLLGHGPWYKDEWIVDQC